MRNLNFFMITASVIVYLLISLNTLNIQTYYKELKNTTQNYIDSRSDALELNAASDYLTSQARLYAVTGELVYSNNYFYESEISHRRDDALKNLKKHTDDEVLLSELEEALRLSNELMETEIYSMRLGAEGRHADLSKFHPDVQRCTLTDKDKALSDMEKVNQAEDMLVNSEYQQKKLAIDTKADKCKEYVISYIHESQLEYSKKLKNTLIYQAILIAMLIVISFTVFVIMIVLVINPLEVYMKSVKSGSPLPLSGAYEFNYLVNTYNNIYDLNEANKNLRYTAEHDPLTGLLNRSAFNDFAALTSAKKTSIALLFMDFDKFKHINDNYGHKTGDEILKKFSTILTEEFRSIDCIARVGGDEFVVIMMNVTHELKPHICDAVGRINRNLADSRDELPSVSVSVGIAFSENGFSDELYKNADEALYKAKKETSHYYFYE